MCSGAEVHSTLLFLSESNTYSLDDFSHEVESFSAKFVSHNVPKSLTIFTFYYLMHNKLYLSLIYLEL